MNDATMEEVRQPTFIDLLYDDPKILPPLAALWLHQLYEPRRLYGNRASLPPLAALWVSLKYRYRELAYRSGGRLPDYYATAAVWSIYTVSGIVMFFGSWNAFIAQFCLWMADERYD